MISNSTLPGTYWIAVEGEEAEEAIWDGADWHDLSGMTRIVGPLTVLSGRTSSFATVACTSVML